jgi:predicted negative regulator of RcsB-dependent stress response
MEETYAYIEQYLSGSLSPAEKKAFQQRCESDPDFAEVVRLHVIAVATERRFAREQRKAAFNAEYDRLAATGEAKSRSLRRPLLYMAAAAAVLALFLVWWNARQSQPAGLEGMIAMHQRDFDVSMQQSRQATVPGSEQMMAAASAYDAGQYAAAIQQLVPLAAEGDAAHQVEARFYLGMSHYQLEQYELALEAFASVPAESAFRPKALWFTALIYLDQQNYAAARPALEAVIGFPGHYRQQAAQELVESLPAE